jgi:subtilisin-like proprotein convertase family protein
MKMTTRNTRGPGAWILGGMASLLMCVSAFGQYSATQPASITINDALNTTPITPGLGSPYPSKIDLTRSNILGVVESVDVTVNGLTHPFATDLSFLLVGPGGSVVLMSGSGGNPSGSSALNNVTLTFSDSASGPLPISQPLVSGTSYQPTDNASQIFPIIAPGNPDNPPQTGYASSLTAAFTNANPNGVWMLYVVDTTPSGGVGGTLGSWTLNIYTTPTITVVTNSTTVGSVGSTSLTNRVDENSSSTISVIIADSSTSLSSLSVGAVKVTSLVTNISSGGTDQNRTITLTPNQNSFGTNVGFGIDLTRPLTLFVDDGRAKVNTNITFEVKHINQPPTISLSGNSVGTVAGLMSTNLIIAQVADPDTIFNPVGTLRITASSSDPTIVAPAGVFSQFYTNPAGVSRAISVVPAGSGVGTATLSIMVDDGAITNSAALSVTVNPVINPLFGNSNSISVAASGNANSSFTIPTNTLQSFIGKVTVAVNGLIAFAPGSSSLSLTAPNGQVINLLANSGPASAVNYGQVVFADGATGSLPANGSLTNTVFLAPASPLGALFGSNPNGTWTLMVQNGGAAAAQIAGGFTVNIFLSPTVAPLADVFNTEESTTVRNFTVSAANNGTVTNIVTYQTNVPPLATQHQPNREQRDFDHCGQL